MGLAIIQENIPSLVVASTTSVTIATTGQNGRPTRITVGGQQYVPSTTLILTTSGTGANGLDTGSLGAIQLWYVYAIVNQSTLALALVASQSSPSAGPLMPSGYGTAFKLVGAFYTNGSSQVASMVTINGSATTDWMTYNTSIGGLGGAGTLAGYPRASFRRNTSLMELRCNWHGDGSAGSGSTAVTFSLPGSYQIDLNRMIYPLAFVGGEAGAMGSAQAFLGSFNTTLSLPISSTLIGLIKPASNQSSLKGSDLGASTSELTWLVTVPIVGWNPTLL